MAPRKDNVVSLKLFPYIPINFAPNLIFSSTKHDDFEFLKVTSQFLSPLKGRTLTSNTWSQTQSFRPTQRPWPENRLINAYYIWTLLRFQATTLFPTWAIEDTVHLRTEPRQRIPMVHPKSFLTFQLTLYLQHYMNSAIHKLKEHKLELKHPYVPKFIKFICNFLNSCPYRESGTDGGVQASNAFLRACFTSRNS